MSTHNETIASKKRQKKATSLTKRVATNVAAHVGGGTQVVCSSSQREWLRWLADIGYKREQGYDADDVISLDEKKFRAWCKSNPQEVCGSKFATLATILDLPNHQVDLIKKQFGLVEFLVASNVNPDVTNMKDKNRDYTPLSKLYRMTFDDDVRSSAIRFDKKGSALLRATVLCSDTDCAGRRCLRVECSDSIVAALVLAS
jgi:hypothetical protein